MSWQNTSKTPLRAASEMVDEFVRTMRGRGLRWDAALQQGALHFDVTPRRVRALLMDEAEKMPAGEVTAEIEANKAALERSIEAWRNKGKP